jgi:hypothetical protein
MANYESELTAFLRSLKQSRPEIEKKQKQARALWWDTNPDPEQWQRWQAARVPQSAYVYYAPAPVKPAEDS